MSDRPGRPRRLAMITLRKAEDRTSSPVTRARYERERPGHLLHVDVKKVARIPDGGGWRALGAFIDHYN